MLIIFTDKTTLGLALFSLDGWRKIRAKAFARILKAGYTHLILFRW